MKLIITSLTPLYQILLIFIVRSAQDVQVGATVGLYGPDRYEGLPEICLKPMDFGYCRAKVQRYYFDIRRMKCNMFFWGGCAGNENNFKSMEECNQFCAAAYDDTNNSIVPPKRERADNIASNNNNNYNTKYNALNSRGSSITKAAPKFTVKNNSNSKETETGGGSIKASAKSFNVNTGSKTFNYQPSTTETVEDEEYED